MLTSVDDHFFAVYLSQDASIPCEDNTVCARNMAYDVVSNALRMSKQANMTFSENIAYGTTRQTREDVMRSHTVVYDEVTLK